MYLFDFQSRLSRCNSRLYIDSRNRRPFRGGYIVSLYFRRNRHSKRGDYSQLAADAAKTMEAYDTGAIDEHVTGVPHGWVPEHDQFDADGHVSARGWRSIVMVVVKRGYCSLERARRVFGCSGLGEADYDRMTTAEKEQHAMKERQRA